MSTTNTPLLTRLEAAIIAECDRKQLVKMIAEECNKANFESGQLDSTLRVHACLLLSPDKENDLLRQRNAVESALILSRFIELNATAPQIAYTRRNNVIAQADETYEPSIILTLIVALFAMCFYFVIAEDILTWDAVSVYFQEVLLLATTLIGICFVSVTYSKYKCQKRIMETANKCAELHTHVYQSICRIVEITKL
jgi:hypothetical protein